MPRVLLWVVTPVMEMIPAKFAMRHGNDLSSVVRLRVPVGDTWEVKLQKEDGKFWLQDGWADFVKHYRIRHGNFVFFSYLGESSFDIVILDVTSCEIEYPIKRSHPRKRCSAHEPSEEVIDLESQPHACCNKKRKRKTHAGHDDGIQIRELQSSEDEIDGANRRGMFAKHLNSERLKIKAQVAKITGGAILRASSYQCKGPSAIIVLGHSSLHPKYMLCLPKTFSEACNLRRREYGDIKLQNTGGRSWTIGYRYYYYCKCVVTKGWKEFAVANDVRLGDVCVLELIERTEIIIRVVIFRGDGKQPCGEAFAGRSASLGRSPRTVDSKDGVKLPSFKVVICKCSAEGHFLHIPKGFSRSHLRGARASSKAILKISRRSWPIELTNIGSCSMMRGLRQFMRDNDLQAGDVCAIELVNKEYLVFKVLIFKN